MSNLILYGLKSVGKTTLGKKLAEQLKRPFIDSDELIELAYQKKEGIRLSCREIFKKQGEKTFRRLEKEVVSSLHQVQGCIIALGGSTLLDPSNQRALKKMGKFLYLHLEKWALKERLFSAPLPLFITEETFDHYYHERHTLYLKLLDQKIELTGQNEKSVMQHLLQEIKSDGK